MKERFRALRARIVALWARAAALLGLRRAPPVPTPEQRQPDEPTDGERLLRVVFVEDEPDELLPDVIYAVGEKGHLWQVTFACPCRCRARIALNLLPDDSPRWRLRVDADVPTLIPSVWRKTGCRSHFFIRQGRVDWCSRPDGTRAAGPAPPNPQRSRSN